MSRDKSHRDKPTDFFPIAGVAERLDVSTRTVRRWISPASWWRIGLEVSCGSPRAICGPF